MPLEDAFLILLTSNSVARFNITIYFFYFCPRFTVNGGNGGVQKNAQNWFDFHGKKSMLYDVHIYI